MWPVCVPVWLPSGLHGCLYGRSRACRQAVLTSLSLSDPGVGLRLGVTKEVTRATLLLHVEPTWG